MSNNSISSDVGVLSLSSKMVRCLLILPLLALILPANTSSGNWGCFAFQHHRHLASTRNGYATSAGSGFERYVPERRLRNDIIGGATPSIQYIWSNSKDARRPSSSMAASGKGKGDNEDESNKDMTSDEGWDLAMDLESREGFKPSPKSKDKKNVDNDAKSKAAAIAELKAEVEAEAKRLTTEADKAAKLKAEQDQKLKEVQAQLALLQEEAEAREKAEKEAAKQQAEAEKKRKQAEEEAAKLAAETKAEEENNRLKAARKAEQMATLLEAKEEAARVMAEIDAKLREETIEADKEEAERVQLLQSEAQQMLNLDDEDDATLKLMMEEMEKVRIELDSRLEAEADEEKARTEKAEAEAEAEAAAKAEAEIEARIKKAEEEAAAKARTEVEARIKKAEEEAAAKAKAELEAKIRKLEEEAAAREKEEKSRIKKIEETAKAEGEANAVSEKVAVDPVADLKERIKTTASDDPPSRSVSAENVKEIPPPYHSKPKDEIIDTTATSQTPPKAIPMPDLKSKSKEAPEDKKKIPKEDPKPKWMVNWDKDETSEKDDQAKAKGSAEEKTNAEKKVSSKKDKVIKQDKSEKAKVVAENEEKEEDKHEGKNSDPRTKGRNRKENLFDVIGRTAGSGVTMDEITKLKKQKPQATSSPPPAEVLKELRKKGPPESFGESVATSHRVGKTNSENKEPRRPMPDLKKKGPPASFGSFATAASSKVSPLTPNDIIDSKNEDNGPPPSFGASVAMASSGDVPQDLLSRGTASTDAGATSVPTTSSSPSRKRDQDSNIIDVLDVVYTKKDDVTKEKRNPSAPPSESKVPPSRPMSSAPPLQVEKTVPPAPPLEVQATVPPIKNPPKKKEEKNDTKVKKSVATEVRNPSSTNRVVNLGKAAVKKVFGENKNESVEDTKPNAKKENSEEKKVDKGDENAKEDRVANLLKEAFSLSKEDSRVGDLLQGVIAITTGKDTDKEKKDSTKNTVAKGRKRARQVAVEEEDDDLDDIDNDFEEEDEDYYDDDYEDEEEDDTMIMGSDIGRNRRMENKDDYRRDDYRRGPRNNGFGNTRDNRYTEPPGGYFEDDDDEYLEYDENDRWRGRGVDSRRSDSPTGPDGYSVRPPPQSRGQQGPDNDDDYYFLQYGSPSSPYDERDKDGYYGDEDDYYYDNDSDSPQPGAPRPAFVAPEDDSVKGPPATFGNFVAGASMSKTGYAPSTMKDDINGGTDSMNGGNTEEFGDEMNASTGAMMSPRGVNGSGRASSQGRSPQAPFVVSEEQGDGGGGRKNGPPSSFGKSVSAAGEDQTGNPSRSIEEEIANGGMATPTGSMASPRIRRKNPAAGGGNPTATPGATGQGAGGKSLFIVSEEDVGTPDFGSSVAEASGARTGWAPKSQKRPTGGLEGGTTGGMRPRIKQPSTQASPAQKKEFGSSVFEDCPPLESTKKRKSDPPLARKDFAVDLNQTHQRNPAVNLVDGGASKNPPRTVQYNGSMMAPRTRRRAPSAQSATAPNEIEGNASEDEKDAK